MSARPLTSQPLASAIAGALLVLGVTGTAWATSAANATASSHDRPPAHTAPMTNP